MGANLQQNTHLRNSISDMTFGSKEKHKAFSFSRLLTCMSEATKVLPRKSIKRISYYNKENTDQIHVLIEEVLDASYGCYIWPSALVMGEFVWYYRAMFQNTLVLEVGAGTSLPSLVLGKASPSTRIIASDIPEILPVVSSCMKLNNVNAMVHAIEWGQLKTENSIDRLLNLIEKQDACSKINYILGSDTFYEPSQFENLLSLVSFVIHHHNMDCKFYTTYQERSPKRSIQYLLDKWDLKCKQIAKGSFEFDELKYVDRDDDISQVKVNAGTLSSVFLLEISSAGNGQA